MEDFSKENLSIVAVSSICLEAQSPELGLQTSVLWQTLHIIHLSGVKQFLTEKKEPRLVFQPFLCLPSDDDYLLISFPDPAFSNSEIH